MIEVLLMCIEGCLVEIDGIEDRFEAYGYKIQVSGPGMGRKDT